MNRDFACTDAKEAEFRLVIHPMIRPLITIIGSAVLAAQELAQNPQPAIVHHEQNIEDALLQLVKAAAQADLLD